MGPIGTGELILVVVVALLVLGPDKLPGAARQVGSFIGELRKMSTQVRSEVDAAINSSDVGDGPPEPQKNKKHPGTDGFELIDQREPDTTLDGSGNDPDSGSSGSGSNDGPRDPK